MMRLTSNIKIGNIEFDFLCDIQIDESIETLTDTCLIKLPKKVAWNDTDIFFGSNALIKKRDTVEVRLGYDNDLKLVFKGYVRTIHRKVPVEIECENEMYRLKYPEIEVSKTTFDAISLDDLLQYALPEDIQYTCADMQLGRTRIENDVPPVKVLEMLTDKSTYGLSAYFQLIDQQPHLFVGLPHVHFAKNRTVQKFKFHYNVISDSLKYTEKDDVKIKVKAISIMPDNSKYEIEVGPSDGGLRTFNYYNISKEDLEKQANDLLSEYQIDGYEGSLTAFGSPYTRKADAVKLYDDRFVPTEQIYSVKSVKRQFGISGYRQTITIDRRIS
jgi:hypothetical protein